MEKSLPVKAWSLVQYAKRLPMTSPAPEILWCESSDYCINYIDFLRYSSVNSNDILRQDREKSPYTRRTL